MKTFILFVLITVTINGCTGDSIKESLKSSSQRCDDKAAISKQVGYNECEIKWRKWIIANQDSVIKIMTYMNKEYSMSDNREEFLVKNYQSILKLYLNYPGLKK